jgi:hypothetical protein
LEKAGAAILLVCQNFPVFSCVKEKELPTFLSAAENDGLTAVLMRFQWLKLNDI